jgi:hypothetical protein
MVRRVGLLARWLVKCLWWCRSWSCHSRLIQHGSDIHSFSEEVEVEVEVRTNFVRLCLTGSDYPERGVLSLKPSAPSTPFRCCQKLTTREGAREVEE